MCRSTHPSGVTVPPEGLLEPSFAVQLYCRDALRLCVPEQAFVSPSPSLDEEHCWHWHSLFFPRCFTDILPWSPGLFLTLGLVNLTFAPWFVAWQSVVRRFCLWCCCDTVLCFPAGAPWICGIIVFLTFGPFFPRIPRLRDSSYAYVGTLGTIIPRFCRLLSVYDSSWIVSGSLSSGS